MTRAIWFGGSVLAAISMLIVGLALRKPCDPPRLVSEVPEDGVQPAEAFPPTWMCRHGEDYWPCMRPAGHAGEHSL